MDIKKEKAINKEIRQLKECVRDKDKRLKEQKEEIKEQDERIETIESRHSTIVWGFVISFVIAGFILLGYTMTHVYSKLPDAVTKAASSGLSRFDFLDPLQFFGFYLICFLAFVGFIALLFVVYKIMEDW